MVQGKGIYTDALQRKYETGTWKRYTYPQSLCGKNIWNLDCGGLIIPPANLGFRAGTSESEVKPTAQVCAVVEDRAGARAQGLGAQCRALHVNRTHTKPMS